jgi:AP-1-like factor
MVSPFQSQIIFIAKAKQLTCNREKLSSCPRVQNGEIDMDSLCTQLQQKAKCSGDGPVIQETDFKEVLNSMLTSAGKPACEDKM